MPPVDVPTFVDIISSLAEEALIDERISHPERRAFVTIQTEYTLEKGVSIAEAERRLEKLFFMKVKYIPFFHRVFMWEYPKEKKAG